LDTHRLKTHQLLHKNDPAPFGAERLSGKSPFLLTADHAGKAIPQKLGDLGISKTDLNRHIGIDIGIHGVSQNLSRLLDAPYLYQPYSRLVIDCNRKPGNPSSIPPISDGTHVPSNQSISTQDRLMREAEIFWPYQNAIAAHIASLKAPPVLIAMHSFTPKHGDYPAPRPWHIGVLFNRDERLARSLIALLEKECDLIVGINQPYAVSDDGDFGIPVHGEQKQILHVEIEIRQDLIASSVGQKAWAERLARLLPQALEYVQTSTIQKAV
jgi:predicted N-formylglutamate amidohydrolase